VVRRTKGGAYIVCEFNGAVWQKKIRHFRVIPYEQRRKPTLGKDIEHLIDVSRQTLDELEGKPDEEDYKGKDLQFDRVRLDHGSTEDLNNDVDGGESSSEEF
jgi:hypothetical protein